MFSSKMPFSTKCFSSKCRFPPFLEDYKTTRLQDKRLKAKELCVSLRLCEKAFAVVVCRSLTLSRSAV